MTAALHPCGGNPLPVGARVVEWGREGLYGRPRPVPCTPLWGNALTPPAPGDHKGPPHIHIHPTTLAPTDHPASCLASRLSLRPIRFPRWSALVTQPRLIRGLG